MAFIRYNENPYKNETIDCVIRGISTFLNQSWDDTFIDLSLEGFIKKDLPHKNYIWEAYLRNNGCEMFLIPNTCPKCTTVTLFAKDHPNGRYLLGTGTHVVAVVDGDYYDIWDSGQELPLYYFERR